MIFHNFSWVLPKNEDLITAKSRNLRFFSLERSRCHPNPCENGGTCHERETADTYQSDWWCECAKGYNGPDCHGIVHFTAKNYETFGCYFLK